jgi:hypothetical protein
MTWADASEAVSAAGSLAAGAAFDGPLHPTTSTAIAVNNTGVLHCIIGKMPQAPFPLAGSGGAVSATPCAKVLPRL